MVSQDKLSRWVVPIAALAVVAFTAGIGCSPAYYRSKADKATFKVLEEKSPHVKGMQREFSIKYGDADSLKGAKPAPPSALLPEELEEERSEKEDLPLQIDIAKALEIAASKSREFQDRKEALFLSALSLTTERHAFAPQFFGDASADYNYRPDNEKTLGANFSLLADWLFATGGSLTAALTSDLSKFLTGDSRKVASTAFSLTFVQPLLKGRGLAATEPRTQAERDVIYQLREYVRFQRSFFVSVLTEYYRVLEKRQILRNEKMNYENLITQLKRSEWLYKAGRMPGFQVDQTRQDELNAKDSFERAQRNYFQSLDSFKLTLGLPTETDIILDLSDLDKLGVNELTAIPFLREKAVEIALDERLDLQTAGDSLEDARRRIKVATIDLKPGLDVVLSTSAESEAAGKPLKLAFNDSDYIAGLEIDLGLERTAERNTYRRRLIEQDAAERAVTELQDRVVLEVRDGWRALFRARRGYEIQQNSVKLAEGRVESTTLLLEAGRADTRDVLEARQALVRAQNSLAGALVDYVVARLELARDIDILHVGLDGRLEENFGQYTKRDEPDGRE